MDSKELARDDWRSYFDRLSRTLQGKRATIEIAGLDIGDQLQAEHVVIHGVVYDPKSDILEVALNGLAHLIRSPKQIDVAYQGGAVEAIHIRDGEEREQIIRFSDPLMLPAPK